MSPVVNLQKLPSNITPDVVVLVSDEEDDTSVDEGSFTHLPFVSAATRFSLDQKEEIAMKAQKDGVLQVAKLYNIPLPDLHSWMTLFGLKKGKQANHEADLAIVRWIIQQQELNSGVELDNMKQYAIKVHHPTNPKFCASKTWLGNFLRRNMSVLQGITFMRGDKTEVNVFGNAQAVAIKQEVDDEDYEDDVESSVLETLGDSAVLEDVSLNEQSLLNDTILAGFNKVSNVANRLASVQREFTSGYVPEEADMQPGMTMADKPTTQGSIVTPFGKRPIIVGQSKSLDAKSERKIVQWVLEKQTQNGYVFTDDFKSYARSLYKGEKLFAATQCWMKKFLRRNRVLKDVRFCSKFKNTYSTEEKVMSVSMAKRFGVTYAAKHTGINHKVIHHWKLASDKGLLNLDPVAQQTLKQLEHSSLPLSTDPNQPTTSSQTATPVSKGQASHGIVPAFEDRIVQQIKELQAKEGSVNYNDISQISQSVYKETRPTFKASYGWIRSFMERRKADLVGIELENVSKVLVENKADNQPYTSQEISEMVDNALKDIGGENTPNEPEMKKVIRPVIVGPSVMFDRKTEKKLVEWALEKHQQDGYVFTDDFKAFAKSLHTGPKHFSGSSGWMSLFLRRHRDLKDVKWKSKFKSVYTEEEKKAAVMEARRLGTGHVARQLGIDSSLLCAWRIKMDRSAPKQHTFWKGTKLKKFGKPLPKCHPIAAPSPPDTSTGTGSDACRGIVPEFENRIIDLIHEEHTREGSISYEEMSKIAQSVYKETRPTFKASYAWIRNFMKRNEHLLKDLDIDNVKKVFMPEMDDSNLSADPNATGDTLAHLFQKRPIIVGQSRSLDTKTEKKLVQWVVEQQEKNGYVFLDQFKAFAQSLYKGEKIFAATQAWRIKFLRRNHNALKHVKFTSSFRNQYSIEEKTVIVQEAKKYGTAHVSKKTGIDHCLINQWRLKLERSGMIPVEDGPTTSTATQPTDENTLSNAGNNSVLLSKLKKLEGTVGPGLYSSRGIVPALEKKVVQMVMYKMDNEGSVSYRDVSLYARAVYKEPRPTFKASYNWVKDFIKRNKKDLRQVEFEHTNKNALGSALDVEVLIPEDTIGDVTSFLEQQEMADDFDDNSEMFEDSYVEDTAHSSIDPMIVIDNPEAPNYAAVESQPVDNLAQITAKKPIIIGKAKHFTRKEEKKIVEWLMMTQEKEGFVFTDDFRRFARSLYQGEPGKFGATNAWISKFMRRNKLENKIEFLSRLVGNNPKYEEKIVELVLEHQEKEGSVAHDDIQKITQSVYKEIRPNFRACYNWVRGFIKRHRPALASVDFENVKKVFIPDENEKDGVLIRDYDPSMSMQFFDTPDMSNSSFGQTSTSDLDTSLSFSQAGPFATSTPTSSSNSIIERLSTQKRPIIIAPPKSLDIKTEKKLVQWMVEQQEQSGCVYLDLLKQYAKSIHTGPKHFAATQAWMIRFKQRNHEALKNIVIKSRFRNEYSIEEKIAIVEEAKRLGCNHVGRKLGINGGVIYSWKVQLENAEKMENSVNLEDSFEAKANDSTRGIVPEFETAIVSMVIETQRAKGSVSYEDVSMCARSVYRETRPQFKASNNWVLDFIRKYKDEFQEVVFENMKKKLTEDEKLHILSEEKKYGTEHVVKKRNISSSTLYSWRRQFKAKAVPIPKFKAIVSSKIKKKYAKSKPKIYTMEEKRKMIAVAEQNGITHASLKLGISRNILRKWLQYFRDTGEQIVINFKPASTLKKELEQKVVAWVIEQNEELGIVLTPRIIEYAKQLFAESYTNCNATTGWLEGFLAQNGAKFENVRFRDKGDTDLEFSDEIKLKVSRRAYKYGATETAELAGLLPKLIYHWRRQLKNKGYDVSLDGPVVVKEEMEDVEEEPKSLMQKKLDKIAELYDEEARKEFASEASIHGTSATASKYKIPLPLVLKWMKDYIENKGSSDLGHSRSSSVSSERGPDKLTVRLPSIERKYGSRKHVGLDKKKLMEEAKLEGTKVVADRSGVGLSTLYQWLKEERDSSVESQNSRASSVTSDGGQAGLQSIKMKSGPQKYANVDKKQLLEEVKLKGSKTVAAESGIGVSTLYEWLKNERESSLEGQKSSVESRGKRPAEKEALAPVLIKNIKKEPELESYPVQSSSETSVMCGRVVRKYSEEFKREVAAKALEMGPSKVSVNMNIPSTNVKRWLDKFKHSLMKAKKPATASVKLPASLTQSPALKRKFNALRNLPSAKRKYSAYTDAEKIELVKVSETEGSAAVAKMATVSVDVVYGWRSKYLPGIRAAKARNAEVGQANMPMQRSEHFNKHFQSIKTEFQEDDEDDENESENFIQDVSITNVMGQGDEIVNTGLESDDELDLNDDDQSKLKGSGVEELEISDVSGNHVHAIDDSDILAADQILERMDAETKNNSGINEENSDNSVDMGEENNDSVDDVDGETKVTNTETDNAEVLDDIKDSINFGKDVNIGDEMNIDDELDIDVSVNIDDGENEEPEEPVEIVDDKSEDSNLDMIQIVNVKSEAALL